MTTPNVWLHRQAGRSHPRISEDSVTHRNIFLADSFLIYLFFDFSLTNQPNQPTNPGNQFFYQPNQVHPPVLEHRPLHTLGDRPRRRPLAAHVAPRAEGFVAEAEWRSGGSGNEESQGP